MVLPEFDDFRRVPDRDKPAIRKMVVRAIRKGACPVHLSNTPGIGLRTIITWVRKYVSGGNKALENRPKRGRPPILKDHHLQWLLRTVRDSNPMQLKFEFACRTLKIIRRTLMDKFDLILGVSTARRALHALGLTPQKPKVKAYQRDDAAFKAWKSEGFPKIKEQARKDGATILFEDEAGMKADYHKGRTWGARGKTPQVEFTGARFGVNMLAAIGADGTLHYRLTEGNSTSETFIEFLRYVLANSDTKIYIVTDNPSIHTSNKVKDFIATQGGMIKLFHLPAYSPQLTPIEQAWSNVKGTAGKKFIQTKDELKAKIKAELEALKSTPKKVRKMFHEPDCSYILACP